MSGHQVVRTRERVPTGRRGRPSKSMIAAAMERPFCAYLHKVCLNNRLEGHKYCIDHIMNDKTAPYRQCTFVHASSGRRCVRAAHKVDRRAAPLCFYHRLIKLNTPPPPVQALRGPNESYINPKEALIEQLAHYLPSQSPPPPPPTLLPQPVPEALPSEPVGPDSNTDQNSQQQQQPPPPPQPIAPRKKNTSTFWDPLDNGAATPSYRLKKTLADFNFKRLSEDLAPIEMPTTEEIAIRHNNADSDAESVDNDYDRFKNASFLTEEEAIRTLRDKMIRLRRLYVEQYSHIQYLLKEKRLKYIQAQRLEDDIHGPIYSYRNFPHSPDYSKLQAMLKYHKTFGPESLLQEQAKRRKQSRPPTVGPHRHPHSHQQELTEKDQQPQPQQQQQQTTTICIFSKTPYGCDKPSIPLSPYCRQHILYDNKQVLFRPCAGGFPPCLTPVMSYTRKNKCWLHTAT